MSSRILSSNEIVPKGRGVVVQTSPILKKVVLAVHFPKLDYFTFYNGVHFFQEFSKEKKSVLETHIP